MKNPEVVSFSQKHDNGEYSHNQNVYNFLTILHNQLYTIKLDQISCIKFNLDKPDCTWLIVYYCYCCLFNCIKSKPALSFVLFNCCLYCSKNFVQLNCFVCFVKNKPISGRFVSRVYNYTYLLLDSPPGLNMEVWEGILFVILSVLYCIVWKK